jgi:hypothetical protein
MITHCSFFCFMVFKFSLLLVFLILLSAIKNRMLKSLNIVVEFSTSF